MNDFKLMCAQLAEHSLTSSRWAARSGTVTSKVGGDIARRVGHDRDAQQIGCKNEKEWLARETQKEEAEMRVELYSPDQTTPSPALVQCYVIQSKQSFKASRGEEET